MRDILDEISSQVPALNASGIILVFLPRKIIQQYNHLQIQAWFD